MMAADFAELQKENRRLQIALLDCVHVIERDLGMPSVARPEVKNARLALDMALAASLDHGDVGPIPF